MPCLPRAVYSDKTLVDYTYDDNYNMTCESHKIYTGADVDHLGTIFTQYSIEIYFAVKWGGIHMEHH